MTEDLKKMKAEMDKNKLDYMKMTEESKENMNKKVSDFFNSKNIKLNKLRKMSQIILQY